MTTDRHGSALFGSTNAAGAGHDAFAEAATSRRSEEQPTSWSAAIALSIERAWARPRWALTRSEAQRPPTSTASLSCREPIRNIRWRQRGLDERCSPDWSATAPLVGISYLTTTSGMARTLVEFVCGARESGSCGAEIVPPTSARRCRWTPSRSPARSSRSAPHRNFVDPTHPEVRR